MFNVYAHDQRAFEDLQNKRKERVSKLREEKHVKLNDELCLKYKHRIGEFIAKMMVDPKEQEDEYAHRQAREDAGTHANPYYPDMSMMSSAMDATFTRADIMGTRSTMRQAGSISPATRQRGSVTA